ncbi:MAG: ribonuclease Z [Prevotella sp.]
MSDFKIHILGCGSALPTLKHFPSSQIVEYRDKMFMIDCGEGTQLQLRRSRVSFNKLTAVFISHMHGDHCFGLIGMISSFGMLGRIAPLHIYAPAGLQPLLTLQIEAFCYGLEYQIVFHDVDTTRQEVIYEDRRLTVTTIPLDHRVPCCGFLFREKPSLPHIRRDMIDFYAIPVSQINNIKNGMSWTTPDGENIPSEMLTFPTKPPRSYAYCSDTKYKKDLHETVKGVTMLYHEATYCDADKERARLYNHSTSVQAAQVALDADVQRLLIGHYSARYGDEEIIIKEARKVFPMTEAAHEMDVYDL